MKKRGSIASALKTTAALIGAEMNLRTKKATYLAASYEFNRKATERIAKTIGSVRSEDYCLDKFSREHIVEWSRDTARNNSLYSGIIRRAVDNMIGSGIWPDAATGDAKYNEALNREFMDMADAGAFDVQGTPFAERQRLNAFAVFREGDVLAYRSDKGWQYFSGWQIATPLGYDRNRHTIKGGVEVDEQDRPVRYHVCAVSKYGYADLFKTTGIRADLCKLIGNREFMDGNRAVPVLGNSLPRVEDLDGMLEAALFRQRGASAVMAEINTTDEKFFETWKKNMAANRGQSYDATKPTEVEMSPGFVVRTAPNEKFTLHSIPDAGETFGEFARLHFRMLGLPLGLPLEIAFLDYSDTNFSSAKALLAQACRTFAVWQNVVFCPKMVDPIWMDYLRNYKTIEPKKSVPHPDSFGYVKENFPWIDALKESRAAEVGMANGWTSITRIAKEQNAIVDDIIRERCREIVRLKEIAIEEKLGDDWRLALPKAYRENAEVTKQLVEVESVE